MLGISKSVLTAVYIALGLFILYRMFFKKNPLQEEYERVYNKILTSDKYKVKGQYDNDNQR